MLLVEDGFVVRRNDLMHIWHAALAELEIISVENFVQKMVWWKGFINSLKELVAHVCSYIGAVGRTEPYCVSVPVLLKLWWLWVVMKLIRKSGL